MTMQRVLFQSHMSMANAISIFVLTSEIIMKFRRFRTVEYNSHTAVRNGRMLALNAVDAQLPYLVVS